MGFFARESIQLHHQSYTDFHSDSAVRHSNPRRVQSRSSAVVSSVEQCLVWFLSPGWEKSSTSASNPLEGDVVNILRRKCRRGAPQVAVARRANIGSRLLYQTSCTVCIRQIWVWFVRICKVFSRLPNWAVAHRHSPIFMEVKVGRWFVPWPASCPSHSERLGLHA
jgi:hypothetical protein